MGKEVKGKKQNNSSEKDLEKLTKELEKKELEIKEKKEELAKQESDLKKRQEEVKDVENLKRRLEKEYDDKKQALNKKELEIIAEKTTDIVKENVELDKIKREITQAKKELEIKKGELEQMKLSSTDKLITYEDKRIQEIEKKLMTNLTNRVAQIEANYKEFLNTTLSTVKWSEDNLNEAFNQINEELKNMLKSKEEIINNNIKDLIKAKDAYEKEFAAIQEIESEKATLNIQKQKYEIKERNFDSIVEKEIKEKYQEIINQNKDYRERLEYYKEQYLELSKQNEIAISKNLVAENLDKVKLKADRDAAIKRLEEYEKLYKEYSKEELEHLKQQAANAERLAKENSEYKQKNYELETQVSHLESSHMQSDSLKFKNEALEVRINAERALLASLKAEVEHLASRIEDRKSSYFVAEAIEAPINHFKDIDKDKNLKIGEKEWLENIMKSCENSGFEFSKRLYYSFHTSLKTADMSPLTVLAGVSGTGKSKLPQLYSKFGGIYFLSIPVKPDWDSPQSLFGYFNSIEKRFDATTLLRAIVMFQKDLSTSPTKDKIEDYSDRVLIVLLDEMNLAYVEQYFSDLLSKLEERRGEERNIAFEVELGAQNDKYEIFLTDNVIWIGTMNEDETTKTLSDKVIDRGNIISFPRPTTFVRYNAKTKSLKGRDSISRKVWESWVNDKVILTDEEINLYKTIVEDINEALKRVNRALGHRVWQSMENYMMSHPLVSEFKEDKKGNRKIALDYAFEEALVHKVMPKLRGINTDGIQKFECLDEILKILNDNNLSLIVDFELAMESVTGTFIWDSAEYLDDKYDKLKKEE